MNIIANKLQQALVAHTVANSGYESKRDYISLSGIYDDVDAIIKRYTTHQEVTPSKATRCYKGYQMEADLLKRLRAVTEELGYSLETGTEVQIGSTGLFKGHPDFVLNGQPGDIKTVSQWEHVPKQAADIPARVKYQMNAYMLASGTQYSYVIYESRDSGFIRVFLLYRDETICNNILYKIAIITSKLPL